MLVFIPAIKGSAQVIPSTHRSVVHTQESLFKLMFIKNIQKGWNQIQSLLPVKALVLISTLSATLHKTKRQKDGDLKADFPSKWSAVSSCECQFLTVSSHISSVIVSKSQTWCILISIYKPLSGFFISLAETCRLHSSLPSFAFYTSTCLIIGFHLLPYFLLWEIYCFSIKGISFHSVICLLA